MKKKIVGIALCAIAAVSLIAGLSSATEVAPEAGSITMCILPPVEVSD